MELTITELSNLTKKTRPTIYKYKVSFENGKLDQVPYSFIKLFEMLNDSNATKKDIVNYCNEHFVEVTKNDDYGDLLDIIKENKDKVTYDDIKKFIEEKARNGK